MVIYITQGKPGFLAFDSFLSENTSPSGAVSSCNFPPNTAGWYDSTENLPNVIKVPETPFDSKNSNNNNIN